MATTATAPAPSVPIPRAYNIATAYIDDLVTPDRADRTAYICGDERVTYAALRDRVNRAGNAFRALGVEMEQRVAFLLPNQPEFVAAFFGAAKIGAVAAPISTAVTASEQIFLLNDSRARALVAAEPLWQALRPRRGELPFLKHILLVDGAPQAPDEHAWGTLMAAAASELAAAPTTCDDMAFWLHTSGSTGTPKWAVHLHRNVPYAEQVYATPVIGLRPDDVLFASGPLFHAYPLGLATYFGLRAGATVVLHRERPTPARVFDTIARYRVTVFAAVPTLYAQLLHAAEAGEPADVGSVRLCLSAAEPLPADLYRRFRARFGVEVLDGIGTTEALHVFMSNRLGDVRPGSSGRPVPGYEVRLLDDDGNEVPPGEIGNLVVRGDSICAGYWNRHDTNRRVFRGEWYLTGDKYSRDADGYYWYRGRTDDMLRVSGHWVSPAEVEAVLVTHPAVLEAAVVGKTDADGLIKPRAVVVLREGFAPEAELARALQEHVKQHMAPYNYPRWVEFVGELPKTATGKIQRYKLREQP